MVIVTKEYAQVIEGQHQGMVRPVIVIVATHCRSQKLMGDHCSGGVCQSTPTTLGRLMS